MSKPAGIISVTGQCNCSQNQFGLVYILELTEKNLFRIKGNIGWALSKCSAVSPLISGAFLAAELSIYGIVCHLKLLMRHR